MKIEDRIKNALEDRKSAKYWELMNAVFPPDQYPKAYNYSSNGGPPGCSMAFNKAIKKMGGNWYGMGSSRVVYF
jgi:hypothetical protein